MYVMRHDKMKIVMIMISKKQQQQQKNKTNKGSFIAASRHLAKWGTTSSATCQESN